MRVWNRIKNGAVLGWKVSVYPDWIMDIERNIYVRICKSVGAISMFITLSGYNKNISTILSYIFLIISLIYIMYKLFLVFCAVKQWIFNLISGKLLVKNSPIDSIGTIFKIGVNSP